MALMAITVLTEKMIRETLPCFVIARWMMTRPNAEEIKLAIEKKTACSKGTNPNNKNCATDMEAEKNTMNAHVAAVTCQSNSDLFKYFTVT